MNQLLIGLTLVLAIAYVSGHARLMQPVSRGSAYRIYKDDFPYVEQDEATPCFQKMNTRYHGECGIQMSESQIYDVIIIGGGASGLSTACKLIELGHENILILEASDRLGGRIHTIDTPDGIIEMGAQWIHGSKGNPLYKLLDSLNETDESYEYDNENLSVPSAYPNGITQKEKDVDNIEEEIMDLFEGLLEKLPRKTRNNESIGSIFENAVEKNSELKSYDPILVKSMQKFLSNNLGCEYACGQLSELSAIGTSQLTEVEYEGNDLVNLKNGYIKLIDHLSSEIQESAIKLNQHVVSINWVGEISTVQAKSVEYGDNINYQGKFIVSSLPLGVLKANYFSLFSPPLPSNKLSSIQRLGFGTVNKFFLIFDKPYFSKSSGVRLLWPEGYEIGLNSHKNSTFYKSFSEFLIVPNRPNILLGFLSGEDSIYSETLTDEELTDILTELFRSFFPKLNLPRPRIIRTKWNSNPLTMGSYSYLKTEAVLDDLYNLSKPIDNKIFFVGEATSVHIGTVNGAYESGIRAAHIIHNIIG